MHDGNWHIQVNLCICKIGHHKAATNSHFHSKLISLIISLDYEMSENVKC